MERLRSSERDNYAGRYCWTITIDSTWTASGVESMDIIHDSAAVMSAIPAGTYAIAARERASDGDRYP